MWAKTSELERMNKTSDEALDFYRQSGIIESSKVELVIDYIREHTGPFTVPDLQGHFLGFSGKPIRRALSKLTSSKELKHHPMDHNKPHIWAKTSKGLTRKPDINKYIESSDLFVKTKTEKIIMAIESHEAFFTTSMIKSLLSLSPKDDFVENILKKLTSSKKLVRVQQGNKHQDSVWIRIDALEKKGLTTEENIQEYFESSVLFITSKSKMEQVQLFTRTLETDFTTEDIQKHFQKVAETTTQKHYQKPSLTTIHEALRRLTRAGELSLLKKSSGNANTWIRTDVLIRKIYKFTQTLTSVFTIADIEKEFSYLSNDVIYNILEKLTDQGKIRPVLQDTQLKWIKVDSPVEQDVSQKEPENQKKPEKIMTITEETTAITPSQEEPKSIKSLLEAASRKLNQVQKEFKDRISVEVTSAEAKEIIPFIESLTGPFEIPNIEQQFPSLSTNQIYKTLLKLTDQNKISLILQDTQLKWIRTDLSPKQGFTQKKPKDAEK